MKDLLFLGMRGPRTLPYTVDRARSSSYRNRVAVLYIEDFIKTARSRSSPTGSRCSAGGGRKSTSAVSGPVTTS